MNNKAIVYPICNGNEKDSSIELLMSLRSIEVNLEGDIPVFILSESKPPYISDKVNFVQVESYQDALVKACEIADEILWMNDDIFLLHKHTWDSFRIWMTHGFNLSESYIDKLLDDNNGWRNKKGKVLKKLKELGKSTFDFSTHTPYLYDTKKLHHILQEFDFGYKTAVETAYGNYFNVPIKPVNKLSRHHLSQLPVDCSKYPLMNIDDKGANPHCRGFLLGMFNKVSKYEKHEGDVSKILLSSIK